MTEDIENHKKIITKQRKKASKKTKGMDKDFSEGFGVSEEGGNTNAENARNNQRDIAKNAKANLLKKNMHDGSALGSGGGIS